LIRLVYPSGNEYRYEYDYRDNLIREVSPNGNEYRYEYEYYDTGQLKRVNDMIVPLF